MHRAHNYNYISLDTEGSELSILETFDFDHYNVRHLSIEHNHTEDEVKIDRFMASKGFERCFPEFLTLLMVGFAIRGTCSLADLIARDDDR